MQNMTHKRRDLSECVYVCMCVCVRLRVSESEMKTETPVVLKIWLLINSSVSGSSFSVVLRPEVRLRCEAASRGLPVIA